MEWKRKLHRAAREQGHRLSPITRDKSIRDIPIKTLPLASRQNEYNAACTRCVLHIHAFTAPGTEVQLTYSKNGLTRWGHEMPPCYAKKGDTE